MATYVEYSYYTATFLGSKISEEDWPALEMRAARHIDRLTFNRAADIISDDTPAASVTAIKKAVCAVVEELNRQISAGHGKEISSESVGGHSVSYVQNADLERTEQDRIRKEARFWLEDTYLMFPGFYTGEKGTTLDDDD